MHEVASLLEKLIVNQIFKKVSAFNVTQSFIAMFTTLSQINPLHILTSLLFKIHFNIILSSTNVYHKIEGNSVENEPRKNGESLNATYETSD